MEPKISGSKADTVILKLGLPNSHRVEAKGFAGGIWVCWFDSIHIEVLSNHFQFIHCRILHRNSGSSFLLSVVYGSPNPMKRRAFWHYLHGLAATIRSPWAICGDFNATLFDSDRRGCASSSIPCKEFQSFVFSNGLRDMGFSGPEFTWSCRMAHARLDRFLCNDLWDEAFLDSMVSHLLRMRSDHRPISLHVGNSSSFPFPPSFKYFSGWNSHEDFARMVHDNWQPSESLSETIKSFTHAADTWNHTVFGYIGRKKRTLMALIRGIQKSLCQRSSKFLILLESELLQELEGILDQEELLWRQKLCTNWVQNGDRNTKYFHRKAIIRRQKKKINSLKLSNNEWCSDNDRLRVAANEYFHSLFAAESFSFRPFISTVSYPVIPTASLHGISDAPSHTEIHAALMDMAPLKAPGWDGLHAHFFQKHWDTVGPYICSIIQGVFNGGSLDPEMNRTILVLIPKKEAPETFADFRPISLCTVLYKLLSKIIVKRLQPIFPCLIRENQTSFIKERTITDNTIINQEAIHSMRLKKTKAGWMAIKVDLEKAFDKLCWDFIQDSLEEASIPRSLIRIIMDSITSSSFQVQWNDSLSPVFTPQRGILQGDPISPYLFVITMERLGHLIDTAVADGSWTPFRFIRNGTPLSHLFFADDLIFYAKADMANAQVIDKILTDFGASSGHKVSKRKTQVWFSPNTDSHIRNSITTALGFEEWDASGVILGFWLFTSAFPEMITVSSLTSSRLALVDGLLKLSLWREG
ncbi:hypothetical protein HRI_005094600 [Hibiscus trionum]|uniref:Reverse transcriptase domain-containing protein n=1 Tax=Hibiscus trionum TaxID=183268 RepID=A0A9W7JIZ6_HIBTR|nr:hypothetical protein HRI_005094600 [Hibiscus trionum]